MSIDAKGIQLLVWRCARFSGICCYKFVRKYPLVSGISIFIFLLYLFFPSVFYFLLYSSPVLACTAVSVWFYLKKTKHPQTQQIDEKQQTDNKRSEDSDAKISSSSKVNRLHKRALRPQKSVRRNARKEVLEWDRKDSEDKDILFKRGPSLFNKTSILEEENPTLASDENGSSSVKHGESSSNIGLNSVSDNETMKSNRSSSNIGPNSVSDNEALKPHSVSRGSFGGKRGNVADGGGEAEVESFEDGEDEEDDGKKAVEWTVDDQKNLMDLGLLELERNKRLESLIAKRRARKLFRTAVDKAINMEKVSNNPSSHIAPILIVKNNLHGVSHNPNEDLQMPGSAPSILLPAQNPFDLPYDPLEEKPNLMADSFHQEFMAANQKDMFLCRHESFCRGPVYTFESTQHPQDAELVEAGAVSRFQRFTDKGVHRRQDSSGIGSNTDLVELQDTKHNEAINSSEVGNEKSRESINDGIEIEEKMKNSHDIDQPGLDNRSEVRTETDSIKNNDSSCSSSSEVTDELTTAQRNKSPGQILNEHMRKNFNLKIPPKPKTVNRPPYDSSPSPSERRRTDFLFYGFRRRGHTPTCSIASDLQVEVSEIGSPPTTDGTVSPVDGDSVTYDGDVDRDANSDNEELWGGSFNLTRDPERAKQIGLDDITEEESAEVEFSDLSKKPEERIPSPSPSEQEAKQTLNNTCSLLSSRMDATVNDASHSKNIELEAHNDVKQIDKEVDQFQTSNVSETWSAEDPGKTTMHLMEKSVVQLPSESSTEKPEQSIRLQDTPTEDLNIVSDMKPVTHGDASTSDSKSLENIEDEAQTLIKPAALMETAEDVNLDSSEFRHGNLETSDESKSSMNAEKEKEERQLLKHIEEDTQNLTDGNTWDAPNEVQSRDDSKSVADDTDDQSVSDDNLSGVREIIGGSIAMALNRRLALAQFSMSSCSSPRSVLPENNLADQIPISNVEQRIQTDVPHSTTVDIEGDNSSDDQPEENLTDNMPQNAEQLIENSMDHQSSNFGLDALEGSYTVHKDSSIKSTEGELETFMSFKDAEEPSRETNPGSIVHPEGGSNKGELETFMSFKNAEELSEPFGGSIVHPEGGSNKGELETFMSFKNAEELSEPFRGSIVHPEGGSNKGELETFMSFKDAEELSELSREMNPGSIVHPEGGSDKVIGCDSGIDPSKSDVPETMVREEIPTHSPSEVIEQGNNVENINNSEVSESQLEAIGGPEKSNDQGADVNKTEANERENTSIPETAAKEEKSVAEVTSISDVNDSTTDKGTEKEILNHVIDGEGEPQMLSREKAILVPSKTAGETSVECVADTEHESKESTNAGQLASEGSENSRLDNNPNGEDVKISTSQEGVLDAPKPREENISGIYDFTRGVSMDHEVAVRESKSSDDSALKAVDPEVNDGNLVAN